MTNKVKIKSINREYQGYAHDTYILRLDEPCYDKQLIKDFLNNYFENNKINTYMGIEFIKPYTGFKVYEFQIIKD